MRGSAAWTVTRIPLQLAVDVRGRLADIAGAIPARIFFLTIGERNVKLAVLDFEKACLCIYVVTPEMCNNEDEIVDYIVELGHNIDMVQYMYGEFEIKSDIIVE